MKNSIKRLTAFVIAVLVVISGMPSEIASAATARATTMKLDSYTGNVTVRTMNGTGKKASKGMRLLNGYEVGTSAAGNAFINLDDEKAVKLDEKTKVQVRQQGKQLELMTKTGKLFFNVKKPLAADESFRVRSSTLVTGVRGTSAYVAVDNDKTSVYLLEGTLELEETSPETGMESTVTINGGEVAVSYKDASDNVVVKTGTFTESDVPYFVMEEIAKDTDLQTKIEEKSKLSCQKILNIKDYMEQGFSQEEAALKAEQDVNKSNTDTTTSSGTGGGSGDESVSKPDGTVSGNTPPSNEGVVYQTDERFADGYPKVTRNNQNGEVTVTYKLREGVASEANPAKVYDVLTWYNTHVDATTEAVIHGHLGKASEESHAPIIVANNCNFFTIKDTNEYTASYSDYHIYNDTVLFSVIDCNGMKSQTPTKVKLDGYKNTEEEIPEGSIPGETIQTFYPGLYLNRDRTAIYMYYSGKLDPNMPSGDNFEIYQNGILSTTQITQIELIENTTQDMYSGREACVKLSLNGALGETTGTSYTVAHLKCKDTNYGFKDVNGNKMTGDKISIKKVSDTITDASTSKDGHYIGFRVPISWMRTFAANETVGNQLGVKVNGQIIDPQKMHLSWTDRDMRVKICDTTLTTKPNSVEFFVQDERKVFNITGDEVTDLEITEFQEDPEVTLSSASYNKETGMVKAIFDTQNIELTKNSGISACNFILNVGGTDYRLRGSAHNYPSSTEGYVIEFPKESLKHVHLEAATSMQIKYDPIGLKDSFYTYGGFLFNNSEEAIGATDFVSVAIIE